jgi:acyl-coenzyme A thioesterase PaaI-like protein
MDSRATVAGYAASHGARTATPTTSDTMRSRLRTIAHGGPMERVRLAWDLLHNKPYGKKIFSQLIGAIAPYSGSISAEVVHLRVGYAETRMRDRRELRNHLQCLHAIALSNLAEYTGNLALAYSLPGDARFIVTRMNMEYLYKARGDIVAVCASVMPETNAQQDVEMQIDLKNDSGALVARGTLFSLVGPVKKTRAGSEPALVTDTQ